MIRNFEEFCLELNTCGFSMGGGNAKESYEKIHQQILLLNPTAEEKDHSEVYSWRTPTV